MNQKRIDEAKAHLQDINKTITALDPAIRSSAFSILVPLYFEDHEPTGDADPTPRRKAPVAKTPHGQTPTSLEDFFSKHEHTKPAINVTLIAAWLYSQHGVVPITAGRCKEISGEVGFTIPNRPDNTMRQARDKGKTLFRQQGKGWVLTTHGELYVKGTYGLRKGNIPLPEGDEK